MPSLVRPRWSRRRPSHVRMMFEEAAAIMMRSTWLATHSAVPQGRAGAAPPIPSAVAARRRPRLDPAIRSDLVVLEHPTRLDHQAPSDLAQGLRAHRPEARPSALAPDLRARRPEARPSALAQDLRDHQAPSALAPDLRAHRPEARPSALAQEHLTRLEARPSALALERREHQAPSALALERREHLTRLEVRLLEAVALDLAVQVVLVLVALEEAQGGK